MGWYGLVAENDDKPICIMERGEYYHKMAKSNKKKAPPSKVNEEDYIKVSVNEDWLQNSAGKKHYDEDFYRIIDFYVLHSPCKVSSYTPRTLESMGWKNAWNSSIFRDTFDSVAGFVEGDTLRFGKSKSSFLNMWNDTGYTSFWGQGKEFAVYTYVGESNPRLDLLHHIRNSFAHGRFASQGLNKEVFLYFEDVTEINKLKGLYASARICLKKTTLILALWAISKRSPQSR